MWEWLDERLDLPHPSRLALTIADDHPDREPELLDRLIGVLRDEPPGESRTEFACLLVHHLLDCERSAADRLVLLATIGEDGPLGALSLTLNVIGLLLERLPDDHTDHLLVDRCLATARRLLGQPDADHELREEIAASHGARLITARHPTAFAGVLADHVAAGRRVPGLWVQELRELPADIREVIADEFVTRMPLPGPDAARDRTQAAGFTAVAARTAVWDAAVRDLAQGAPRERRWAAHAVGSEWTTATWRDVVPTLLTAGVDTPTTDHLVETLTSGPSVPALVGVLDASRTAVDLVTTGQARRTAVDALRAHPGAAVRAFVRSVDAELDRRTTYHEVS